MEENEHKNKEGWIGKPKGMLQVLWEKVWVYTFKLNEYNIRGKKDEKCTVIKETSMLHIMDQCRDFSEEDTQLQYIGIKLGATFDRTLK